jgi:hypothetical protein
MSSHTGFFNSAFPLESNEMKPHGIVREVKTARQVIDGPRPLPQECE